MNARHRRYGAFLLLLPQLTMPTRRPVYGEWIGIGAVR